jgi:hypothetical protein
MNYFKISFQLQNQLAIKYEYFKKDETRRKLLSIHTKQ